MTNVAALDCGSNSTRLLIADASGRTLARDMTITRLSAGVDATGALTEEAIGRTLDTLVRYREQMDAFGVAHGLLVATSAVRDASNGADFLTRAAATVGVPARVLAGQEEAQFSYQGATAGLPAAADPTMIVDIGGGSTELAVLLDGELIGHSMQLGCVRVTERALLPAVVTPERAAAAEAMIQSELDRAFAEQPRFAEVVGHVRLVGLAGTVATLAQLTTGRATYDRDAVHHQALTRAQVLQWRDELGRRTPDERLALPGMVPGREDVLTAGLYILDAVLERFACDHFMTSEDDILDGVVQSLIAGVA